MPTLMRSPKPVASWFWMLDNPEGMDFLLAGCSVASNISQTLQGCDLLYIESIGVEWEYSGGEGVSYYSQISGNLNFPHHMAAAVRGAQPVALSEISPYRIDLIGSGNWISSSGQKRGEPRLLSASAGLAPETTSIEISVHHDIWGENDFFGKSHPEVHAYNSPRLHNALTAVEGILGFPGEADEPTYFGSAKGYYVQAPFGGDGSGLDVTDRL